MSKKSTAKPIKPARIARLAPGGRVSLPNINDFMAGSSGLPGLCPVSCRDSYHRAAGGNSTGPAFAHSCRRAALALRHLVPREVLQHLDEARVVPALAAQWRRGVEEFLGRRRVGQR